MSESQIDQLKLAEKLENHFLNLGYHQYWTKLNTSINQSVSEHNQSMRMSKQTEDSRITKLDLLPLLGNPKVYKLFEFISRNVHTKEITVKLRKQLEAFENKR